MSRLTAAVAPHVGGKETMSVAAANAEEAGKGADSHRSPLLLVVDDDDIMRAFVVQTLTPEGFRVAEAATAEAGLEAFPRIRPDIILLDLNLPGMSGFECCERIRSLPDGRRVPILILTSHDDEASITQAYAAGATDFASKPMQWTLLAHRVRYLMRGSEALEDIARGEARFRSLVELSSDWYWEQDEAFRFTFTSTDGPAKSGISVDGILGKARWELPIVGVSEAEWQLHKETLAARQPFRDFEYQHALPGGDLLHLSISGEPVFDADGRFTGYRGVGRNITDRRRAERRLAAHAERQERIASFAQRALKPASTESLFAQAVQAVTGANTGGAAIFEVQPETGRFVVRAAHGDGSIIAAGTEFAPCAECGVTAALRSSGPVVTVGGRMHGCQRVDAAWPCAARASISAPIRGERAVIGILAALAAPGVTFTYEDAQYVQTVGNIVSSAVQRRQAEARLAHLARYDGITGLPNRNLLRDRLDQAIPLAKRDQRYVAVLFADIDRFKLVNDTFGHPMGDRLLSAVGKRIRPLLRASDTVARVSGDEFVIMLPDLGHADAAATVAQKVLDSFSAPFVVDGQDAFLTASIGIAVYPRDGCDGEALLKAADSAMYRAKDSGRGGYCFFTAELEQHAQARMQLQTDLRRAIERGEFRLVYQPKIDLTTQRVCGVEALLRWQHPQRGLVSPADFIPALEETGLIVPAGEWVIEAACRQIRAWRQAGLIPVPIAVNVSARQFQMRDLDRRIIELVRTQGVDPFLLELEITESYLVQDPEHAIEVLQRLREAGIRISIDDFGTGYSSLSYLTRFPVSALKVDRSFVRDATTDGNAGAIVRAVIDMAHNLGFVVIAEGVETAAQVAFLRMHGCDLAQGFFFGRPTPPEAIAELLGARPALLAARSADPDQGVLDLEL